MPVAPRGGYGSFRACEHRFLEVVDTTLADGVALGPLEIALALPKGVADRTRARHRLSKFLLRHGAMWRGGNQWTLAHDRWLRGLRLGEPALQATFRHYLAVLEARDADLGSMDAGLVPWFTVGVFAEQVARLAVYRGVDQLGALTFASEVCDFRRFASARCSWGLRAGPIGVLQR